MAQDLGVTDDVNCDHLIKMASARLLHCKASLFIFVFNKYSEGMQLKLCKYPIPQEIFSVFICIYVDSLFSILSLGYNPLVSSSFILKLKLCLIWLEEWRKGEHPR